MGGSSKPWARWGATALGVSLLVVLATVGVGSARGGTPAFVDAGTGITCAIAGSISFSPPLTYGATGESAVSFKDKMTNCTGAVKQFGVTIMGGRQKLDSTQSIPSNCLPLIGNGKTAVPVPGMVEKTRYLVPRRQIAPHSTLTTWATGQMTSHGFAFPFVITYTIATAVTGSFSTGTGPPASFTEVLDQVGGDLIKLCQQGPGISEVTFSGTNGASSVTLG